MKRARGAGFLRIGEVARSVGVSPSVLRSWEMLGLIEPQRSRSRYRLYSHGDVKLLKRAQFLRRVRGLNAPAIFHLLKSQGLLRAARPRAGEAASAPRSNGARPLGAQLRSLRVQRGLPLSDVAAAAGISVGFLSAIERGQMSASVGTLRKLARFYNTNILAFFNPSQASPHRVRPADRKRLEAVRGVRMELLAWGDTVMEPHVFRIARGASSGESYAHEGEEFLYILRGQLEITLDENQAYRLRVGDSFYFESATPHRWWNPGSTETWVLWVNTPPTF